MCSDLRAKRGGHIPRARNRLFSDLLTDEGTFRPVGEMVSLVRASGADSAEIWATQPPGQPDRIALISCPEVSFRPVV